MKKYPNIIKSFHKKNEGLLMTRRYGYKVSRGMYIINCDSDDFVETNLLSSLSPFLDGINDVIIYNMYKYQEGRKSFYTKNVFGCKRKKTILKADCIVYMHSTTFKKEVIKRMGPIIDENCFYVDLEYTIFPLYYIKNFVCLDYALGFSYYSNIPYMVLVVTLALFWLANSQKKEKIVLITSIPIQILIYKVSTTRLVLGIYCVFMVAVLLSRLLNTNKKHKVLIFFSAIMFPCAAIITFLISIYYTKNSFFMTLNKLLNNRLEFNARAFRMYNISIGGQKIITSNGGFDGKVYEEF